MKPDAEIIRCIRKPDTQRVMNYLWSNRHRRVPSSELLRKLHLVDYRKRVSEIRDYFEIDGVAEIESARMPGRAINYYRIVQTERKSA